MQSKTKRTLLAVEMKNNPTTQLIEPPGPSTRFGVTD
jgi:hypothetical protein